LSTHSTEHSSPPTAGRWRMPLYVHAIGIYSNAIDILPICQALNSSCAIYMQESGKGSAFASTVE
jgi:hypothetical protein